MSDLPGPPTSGAPQPAPQGQSTCPRHPSVVAYTRCQRCDRPACPQCQVPAAVGYQCVDCVKQQQRSAPVTRSVFGGRATDGRLYVTFGLIALCALVYVGQLVNDRVTSDLAYEPYLGEDEPWRFLTAAFVHSTEQQTHILFNMFALWMCGQYLEPLLGRARYLALYLVSAIGGSVGYELLASAPKPGESGEFGWYTQTVGASGAVFGLFLAVVVLNRHLGRDVTPMLVMIGINAALPIFFPSNVAWQAHLGGAVTGGLVAGVIALLGKERRQLHWLALGGVLLLCVGLAVIRYGMVDAPAPYG